MTDLNQSQAFTQFDTHHVLESVSFLAKQCHQAWEESKSLVLPHTYQDSHHVVVAGMGGSHLGGNLIQSAFASQLKIPLILLSDYHLPGYIGPHSLVILTSYSGNTEEVLTLANQALSTQANLVCIASGGKLADFATSNQLPGYLFSDIQFNPSQEPRYGSGYLFMSLLSVLNQAGVISISDSYLYQSINFLEAQLARFEPQQPEAQNPAKQIARQLQGKAINLIASEHLLGPAYIFKNQLNESAKNYAVLFELPELNHHLLEGLKLPESLNTNSLFFSFPSSLYHPRTQLRYPITHQIIEKQNYPLLSFSANSPDRFHEALEVLAFSSFTALYLSLLNQVDPHSIPWVDFLKSNLGKS